MIGRLAVYYPWIRKKWNDQKGQSVVETALILPLVLLLLFGLITFGLIIYSKIIVALAASQSARAAAAMYGEQPSKSVYQINSQATKIANSYLNQLPKATSKVEPKDATYKELVEVKVTYNYHLILPFMEQFFPSTTVPLSYTATYRKEGM